MISESGPKFKALIVGGGPIGLMTAHALTAAGIDFTLLESHHAFETDNPSLVVLWPHTLRLMDQLGLLDEVKKVQRQCDYKTAVSSKGQQRWETSITEPLSKWHGMPSRVVQRNGLMDLLAKDLKDKPNVQLRKRVESIQNPPNGRVQVTCTDGTTEEGSIVIGADGPWSVVRKQVTAARRARNLPVDPENPFKTYFVGVFVRCKQPAINKMPTNRFIETRGADVHFQCLADDEFATFAIYRKLETTLRERRRYSQDDIDAVLKQYEGRTIINGLKVRDLLPTKVYNWMTNIEEGRVHHWHEGRMVLVGDSTHKMCPQPGFGFNTGMQGVTELVNRLHDLLQSEGQQPSDASLESVFAGYQANMKKHEAKFNELSAMYVRQIAHQYVAFRVLDRFLYPYIGGDLRLMKLMVSPTIAEGRVFQFLEERNRKDGKYAWKNVSHAGPSNKTTAAI